MIPWITTQRTGSKREKNRGKMGLGADKEEGRSKNEE
jgi:hypothetical protein